MAEGLKNPKEQSDTISRLLLLSQSVYPLSNLHLNATGVLIEIGKI